MVYHLETIPVWEAVEQHTACPVCLLWQKCEESEIERSLGGSVMEPDERVRVNEKGMCRQHHEKLLLAGNRLGHALMTDTHSIEVLKKLEEAKATIRSGGGGLFARKDKDALTTLLSRLDVLNHGCVICDELEQHMQRYLYTFVHLWKKDSKFAPALEQGGFCLPHAEALLKMAQKELSGADEERFAHFVLDKVISQLKQNEEDLKWFTLKFDYRNQDKPWGNSKDALERTITQLRGR